MTVFFSAGEASGDAYAYALVQKLLLLEPAAKIIGIGGAKLRESGAKIVADSSRWGALGIFEAARVIPRVLRGYFAAKQVLRHSPPGIFVPIDFGFVNIKLSAHAKRLGWKVLYFIPPGSWRRNKQGADLPNITDEIVTPFPWSGDLLNKMGARAHFFGHPLKQMIAESNAKSGGWERNQRTIAILPGSRAHEWTHNLPAIAEAVRDLDVRCEFAVAPSARANELEAIWGKLAPNRATDLFTERDTYGVLSRARAGIICSGTATLEAALCGCPCVVVYRAGKWMELEYRIRKPRFDYIALPNILLNRAVVAELIQHDASPVRIAEELRPLLTCAEKRSMQLDAFTKIDAELGGEHALDETVKLIINMAQNDAKI